MDTFANEHVIFTTVYRSVCCFTKQELNKMYLNMFSLIVWIMRDQNDGFAHPIS